MGSIVYIEADNSSAAFPRWLVIDGQQRLTTLTLLIIALRDRIAENGLTGGEDGLTTDQLDGYYLKNIHEQGLRQFKLVLRRTDNETLQSLVSRKNISELEENNSQLVTDAYKFFENHLASSDCNLDDVYRGVTQLNIVDVKLERRVDNPQLVFESLNSTGVDLSQSDLVRNYLLMGMEESEQTRLYNTYWL